jgi:parvulin-like peptidyl-prolyl isomerase
VLAFAATTVWFTGGGPWAAADDAIGDAAAVVLLVGDKPLYQQEFEAALRRSGYDETSSPEQKRQTQATVIEQMVDERLLRGEIKRQKIEVGNAEVDAVVEQIRSQLASRKITLAQFLAQSGGDEQSLRSQLSFEIGLKKLLGPRVTSDALTEIYRKHHRDLDGTRLRASHILLRPDTGLGDETVPALVRQANEIRGAILRGEMTFADAAQKFSAGPSRRQGGDLGFFPRQGAMVEEFAREAFSLARGEISKPLVTPFGIHLITITDIQPGNADPELLRPQLEKILAQECLRELTARARETTPIAYSPGVPHFDPATPAGGPQPRRIIVGHAAE